MGWHRVSEFFVNTVTQEGMVMVKGLRSRGLTFMSALEQSYLVRYCMLKSWLAFLQNIKGLFISHDLR